MSLGLGAVAWLFSGRARRRTVLLTTLAAVAVTSAVDAWQSRARGVRVLKAEDERVDESLDQSFPASDPPAHNITGAEPPPTEVPHPTFGPQSENDTH